jgi:hypothetical protein
LSQGAQTGVPGGSKDKSLKQNTSEEEGEDEGEEEDEEGDDDDDNEEDEDEDEGEENEEDEEGEEYEEGEEHEDEDDDDEGEGEDEDKAEGDEDRGAAPCGPRCMDPTGPATRSSCPALAKCFSRVFSPPCRSWVYGYVPARVHGARLR